MGWQDITAIAIAAGCALWALFSIVRPFLSKGGGCGASCGGSTTCAPAPEAQLPDMRTQFVQIEPCEPT